MVNARVLGSVAVLVLTIGGTDVPPPTDTYLRGAIGLSSGEVKRFASGQVVTTTLDGRDGREVVTFGAVRISRPPELVFDYLSHVDALRHSPAVRQVRTLRAPPDRRDFATFTLDPATTPSLRRCARGNCDVQLPGWAIDRFRNDVPWQAPGVEEAVHRVARDIAMETFAAYLQQGHRALSPYEDKSSPTSPSAEYARLLASAEFLPAPLTAVRHALDGFPHRPARGIRDQFFWTVVDFGLKPTFRLSHMAAASGPALDDPADHLAGVVVTMQLLATHYFSSTLEWHFVARDPGDPSASVLYYLSRSSSPGLSGLRGRFSRSSARSRGREAAGEYLASTRRTLES